METTTNTAPATTSPKKVTKKAERTVLKTICASLRIDPKAARRRLRKAGFSWHGSRERWTMNAAQEAKVREILKESDIERVKPAAKRAPSARKVTAAPAQQPSA